MLLRIRKEDKNFIKGGKITLFRKTARKNKI